jgi:hypothetical protein
MNKFVGSFRFVLVACFGTLLNVHAQTPNPYARPAPAPTAAKTAKGHAMDDLTAFATDGAKVLESVKGDLTGAGHADVLLVLDPPAKGDEKLGQGPNRNVILLIRDDAGQLHKASANAHIIPCALCGGVSGDPYAYSKIGKGQFTIVIGGGSRERWTDEYTFTYVSDKKNWITSGVARKVTDTDTGKEKHLDLTSRELGTVLFSDFDPSHLPEPTLP